MLAGTLGIGDSDMNAFEPLVRAVCAADGHDYDALSLTPRGRRRIDDYKRYAIAVLEALEAECTSKAPETQDKLAEAWDKMMTDKYPDLATCPHCGGEADNGHDRSFPDPIPYACSKCTKEWEPD